MDAFVLIAVIWLIASSFSKAAKQKTKKNPVTQALEALGQPAGRHPYAPSVATASPSVFYPAHPDAMDTSASKKAPAPNPRPEEKPAPRKQALEREGEDPCHVQLFQRPERVAAVEVSEEAQAGEGMALSFAKDSLIQAVVMQEILTRPCDRQRRFGH